MQTRPFAAHRSRMFDPGHVYDRIVVPVDLDETSCASIRTALDLKRRYGSRIVLFHVANANPISSESMSANGSSWALSDVCEDGLARLRMMMENVAPDDVDSIEYDVVGSVDVVDGVRAAAIRHNATLVVLAVDADSEHTHLLRSRSEKIAKAVGCTVMMVHPTKAAPTDR